MELLGERPAWSMSGSEALADIDSIHAEIARLETARLSRVARVDETGHAAELGARNTAELLTLRHRMDPRKAHALVRLALALPKYSFAAPRRIRLGRPCRPGSSAPNGHCRSAALAGLPNYPSPGSH